jgi:hypothetical protein
MRRKFELVRRNRDHIDDAFKLLRGEATADGAVFRTVFPPGGTPIEKKYYAAAAQALADIARELQESTFPELFVLTLDNRAARQRLASFAGELAGAFAPDGSSKRKATVGDRGHGEVDRLHKVSVSMLVDRYMQDERLSKTKAIEAAARLIGVDATQVWRACRWFEQTAVKRRAKKPTGAG